jgi:hypothetical protein
MRFGAGPPQRRPACDAGSALTKNKTMTYACTLGLRRHVFGDLKTLLAKASPARSGDMLAGVAAASEEERMAARIVLADLPLARFLQEAVVPYESDEVTRLIIDGHDAAAFAPVAGLTVGEFRDWLLSDVADSASLQALAPGLTPEMVAAVSKLMRNQDLILVAAKCQVITRLSQHPRPARPAGRAPAAQPPHRRSPGHRRVDARRPALWRWRCGDRHQPGHRQPARHHHAAAPDRRLSRAVRGAHPELRAHPRHQHAPRHRQGCPGGSGVPVDRRHRGGEPPASASAPPCSTRPTPPPWPWAAAAWATT